MGTIKHSKASALLAMILIAACLVPALPALTGADEPAEPEKPKLTYRMEPKKLAAIDETGKEKWARQFTNEIVRVIPEGDYLFVITKKEVVLLTPLSGIERWTERMADVTGLEIREPKVILRGASSLGLVDINSGKEDWQFRHAEEIESYVIHENRLIVAKTAKRVLALDYANGGKLVDVVITSKQNYLKSETLGPALLLHFEEEIQLWNAAKKKELPEIKKSALAEVFDADLAKTLKDTRDKVASRNENDRVSGMVMLVLLKVKEGKLMLQAGLSSEDAAVLSTAQDIMKAMAEYSRSDSEFLAGTTEGVLEQAASMDSSGSIEKAYYSAYFEKYSFEMPNAEATLKAMVMMLRFTDKEGRGQAIKLLEALTGKTFDYKPTDGLKERNAAVKKWEKWLSANQGRFVWDIPGRRIKIRE